MSKYTTGEIAKLCGVTVRTVQFYDGKGILIPSELTEGGRRLYSEDDLTKLKFICLLKSLGIGLEAIRGILESDNSEFILSTLLEEQAEKLREEIAMRRNQLENISVLQSEIKELGSLSTKNIGDIEDAVSAKKEYKKVTILMAAVGIPLTLAEDAAIVYGFCTGRWLAAVIMLAVAALFIAFIAPRYYRKVVYVCPECHKKFKPRFGEFFFANHTFKTRKLTCTHCGKKDWCIECYGEAED